MGYVFIPSRVEVTPGRVTLLDISATYTGLDPEDLESIVLAYLPSGEYTLQGRYITSMALRKGIQVTLESSTVELDVIEPETDQLMMTDIPTDVLNEASEVLRTLSSDMELPLECIDATVLEYTGRIGGGTREIRYTRFPNGVLNAYITYRSGRRVSGSFMIKMAVSCVRKVYISKRIIKAGDTIYPDMLEERDMNVFEIFGTPAGTEALYSVARRTINPGEIITKESIKRKPDVHRGQLIMAYVELPGVRVSVLVEVLENGYVGDMIKAVNASTGKIITGILEPGPLLRVAEVVER